MGDADLGRCDDVFRTVAGVASAVHRVMHGCAFGGTGLNDYGRLFSSCAIGKMAHSELGDGKRALGVSGVACVDMVTVPAFGMLAIQLC